MSVQPGTCRFYSHCAGIIWLDQAHSRLATYYREFCGTGVLEEAYTVHLRGCYELAMLSCSPDLAKSTTASIDE
jgi:hypothetical protein